MKNQFQFRANSARVAPLVGALFLALTLPLPARVQGAESNAKLAAGVPVALELAAPLSSRHNHNGDEVTFRVKENIIDENGRVLIAQGAAANGHVTEAKRSGFLGRKGKLNIALDFVTAADGQKVSLRGERNADGKSRRNLMVASVVLLTPFGLVFKGGNVTLPPGQNFTAYTNTSATLDLP